jgi:hypothetical protein
MTAGDILVGSNCDKFSATLVSVLDFSVSIMLLDKKKLVLIGN